MTDDGNLGAFDTRARLYVAAVLASSAAIVAIEAALVVPGHVLEAQIAHAVLLFVLVNAGPRRDRVLSQRAGAALAALRALSLVPLIRVVALGLPMRSWSEPVSVLAIALPVTIVALRLAPLVGLQRRRMLWIGPAFAHLYAITAGCVLGLVAYLVGAPKLWSAGAADGDVAAAILAAVAAACCEELVFRSLVQSTLQRAIGRVGILVAAAIFAASYLDAGPTELVLTFALAGVVFSGAFARSGALIGVMAGHVILVVSAGAVWPALLHDRALEPYRMSTTIALAVAIAVAGGVALRGRPASGQFSPEGPR
jgi:membrane protease YdiL (CAAX protease family)